MAEQFKVGDSVKLAVGKGPEMSVHRIFTEVIRCQWFAGSKLSTGDFSPEQLVKVEKDEKSQA